MKGRFLFLGSGGSLGVPIIGCTCGVCTSPSPKNKRFRPSGLLEIEGKKFLIDPGPDFRMQALEHGIDHLDGIFITHTHNDHIAGIDDLRIYFFRTKKKMPCLLSEETLKDLRVRYHYMLHPRKESVRVSSQFHFTTLPDDFGKIVFEGIAVQYMSYFQAGMKVTGFRFDNFAYVSDIHTYSDAIFDSLQGVEILIISAPRWMKSPVHFKIEEAIHFSKKIGAKKTFVTHITHDLDHEKTNSELPEGVALGYDGLSFEIGR